MLRWICSRTFKDKIRNKRIASYLEMTPIEDEIRKGRLTWYVHVIRKSTTTPIRTCLGMQISARCTWRPLD